MNSGNTKRDYFRTRGYVPGGLVKSAGGKALAVDRLPPILRVLLATDGTVTKSLEAYFWEPVAVDNLGQAPVVLAQDVPALEAHAGEEVLQRRVRLKGIDSGKVYAYAESTLRLTRLPTSARDGLLTGRIGIGELLRECGLETYREILDIGSEDRVDLAVPLERQDGADLVYRTYRISLGQQPTILITEHFPAGLYAAPLR